MHTLQINKETAKILAPLAGNELAFSSLFDYATYKIAYLNGLFLQIDPNNSAEIGRIQGQIHELTCIKAIRDDVKVVMEGRK